MRTCKKMTNIRLNYDDHTKGLLVLALFFELIIVDIVAAAAAAAAAAVACAISVSEIISFSPPCDDLYSSAALTAAEAAPATASIKNLSRSCACDGDCVLTNGDKEEEVILLLLRGF
jgi:hypothetical protein